MKIASLLVITLLAFGNGYAQSRKPFLHVVGMGVSFNAVADEAIAGGNVYVEHNMINWKNGRAYLGLNFFYGAFPSSNPKMNQYISGRTSLLYPVHLLMGHQFIIINQRLLLRTELDVGPSIFKQKVTMDDPRFALHDSYLYTHTLFTGQAKLGMAYRTGSKFNIELFMNVPVIHAEIAPLGVGFAINRRLE